MATQTPAKLAREQRVERLKDMLSAGYTLAEAAEKLGVSSTTAWNYAKAGGFFQYRNSGAPRVANKGIRSVTQEFKYKVSQGQLKRWKFIRKNTERVPVWVPGIFRIRYLGIWQREGEMEAARQARAFKRTMLVYA